MNYKQQAVKMLQEWKSVNYAFGMDCFNSAGKFAKQVGKTTMLVVTGWNSEDWIVPLVKNIKFDLLNRGIEIQDIIKGAKENAPREDVYRIANQIGKRKPDSIVTLGGGSTIGCLPGRT